MTRQILAAMFLWYVYTYTGYRVGGGFLTFPDCQQAAREYAKTRTDIKGCQSLRGD